LDLNSLKNSRMVCKAWSQEAARAFKNNFFIRHQPLSNWNHYELSIFVSKYFLKYTLIISLLDSPWYFDQNEEPVNFETILRKYF